MYRLGKPYQHQYLGRNYTTAFAMYIFCFNNVKPADCRFAS
ncbi:MAG: hypothetical protein GQF41_2928 [Candidatus Rifleibacterium amylolyticum]|nr:MAG: hypothetical protein GQF41_2928 [Candidatus Rifleibacterium amylolyticum]